VAFTGSVVSGRKVNACAASNGIPTTMELGGKSALLVFDDADVEKAVEWCMVGACMPPASSLACSNHMHMQSACSAELAEQHMNFCSRVGMPAVQALGCGRPHCLICPGYAMLAYWTQFHNTIPLHTLHASAFST